MNKQFLTFPDADILLFHEPLKGDSKLDLDLFPDDGIEDPFSYRDDSLSSPSYCGTPEMHLPLSTGTSPDRWSPGTPDSGSLSDIPSLDPIDAPFSNLTFARKDGCYEEDLDFRAPFIPMQMDDDFPLLSPSNSVMWGPPQETPTPKNALDRPGDTDPLPKPKPSSNDNSQSSLAALLQSNDTANKKTTATNNNARHNDRNNRRWHQEHKNAANTRNQRNLNSRSSTGGHIIMLDSVPARKPASQHKPAPGQRRGATSGASPSIGSHTSTVRVNDRLIKVQVSVSELPSALPIEQPFPSPPDPPPKRASPPSTDSPKRIKVHNAGSSTQGSVATSDSVLLNLLISGEDASRGYLCSGNSRYAENKPHYEPAVLSLPPPDLASTAEDDLDENDLLDSYLKIQYESALHSDELLEALDHPLLRNGSVALG